MKKTLFRLCAFIILSFLGIFIFLHEKAITELHINDQNGIEITIDSNGVKKQFCPYENPIDGLTYFFLPSYMHDNTIYVKKSLGKAIVINGKTVQNHHKIECKNNEIFTISVTDNTNNTASVDYQVVFMKSANIPALFIDTQSGSMESIHSDKEFKESGKISIIEESGNLEYNGKLASISGRGNVSWGYDKKSYSIKLQSPKALLGMDSGKKWCLLPIFAERSRINTKVVLDIASELGLAFTSECTWVDLYLNGEYNGNYLLCEAVTVGDGRIEINDLEAENRANNSNIDEAETFKTDSYKGCLLANGSNVNGGYLVEKDAPLYYNEEKSGFQTESGAYFSLKSPEHASKEQVEYIMNYFQTIENMITGNTPDYDNYIDLDSFAARFLVEEISLNYDANITSTFFYKDSNNNLLFAGPVWDYDASMGWVKENANDRCDYEQSIFNVRADSNTLNWYQMLYENKEFYDRMTAAFENLLPYIETLLESKIDEYVDYIRVSAQMDMIRWEYAYANTTNKGHYVEFDNNVRHLKYYLANRVNYLCKKWNISHKEFTSSGNGEQHNVSFIIDNVCVETRMVPDGAILTSLPPLDEEVYMGWYLTFNEEKYFNKLPIYEDCTLYAKKPDETLP